MMRTALVVVAAALMVAGLSTTSVAAQYPRVASAEPFSAQANYMSLPGYLRYVVHQRTGLWLTRGEARHIVLQQRGE
jgi:hypothetical protein